MQQDRPTSDAWNWQNMRTAYIGDGYEERIVEVAGTVVSRFRVQGARDFVEEFEALPDGWCSSSHFGYIIRGSARVISADGTPPVNLTAGQAYFQAPGHRVEFLEATELLEFSPADEWWRVVNQLSDGRSENA